MTTTATIPSLSAAGALDGSEPLETVQGSASVRTSAGAIAGLALADLAESTGASLVGSAAWYAPAITTFDATALPDGASIAFAGRSAAQDGGGGVFTYSAASTQTVDDVLVFAPTGGGRLFRDGWTVFGFNGDIVLDWAGAAGDGSTNDSAAIQIAVRAAYGGRLRVPANRVYGMLSQVLIEQGLEIVGTRGTSVFKALPGKSLTVDLFATITTAAPVRTVKNGMFQGIVFDGGSLAPQRWLQAGAGGAAITNPEADYYNAISNPTGKIGNPAFPAWTIADTVAAGRRNASYTDVASLLNLALAEDFDVHQCTFRNHYGRGVFERGGLNVSIYDNDFDTVGKKDGAYHAIYTQSFGTPGAGQAFYSPSENIKVYGNRGRNLERSLVAFMPTKGGMCIGNSVDGWMESCIYISDVINYDGGFSWVKRNTMKNGVVSDIVCWGIEAGKTNNLLIEGNWIEGAQQGAGAFMGATNVTVRNNTAKECGSAFTYPYGPFSERYAFNVGTPWVAGTSKTAAELFYYGLGTEDGIGCDNLIFKDNNVIDARVSRPAYVFTQTKSGGNSLAGTCVIEGGNLPSGMSLLDATIGTVWQATMPLSIRHVVGHASAAPVIVSREQISGDLGVFTVTPGFRPRAVHVYAAPSTGFTEGRAAVGAFAWTADGVRDDFSLGISVDAADRYFQIHATDVVRITNTAGVDQLLIEFTAWKETGFQCNVLTSTETMRLRFVCVP